MKRLVIVLLFGLAACGSTATKSNVVYKTPAVCTQALDLAEQVVGKATDGLSVIGTALTDLSNGDTAALYAAPDQINLLTSQVKTLVPKYQAARDACEADA